MVLDAMGTFASGGPFLAATIKTLTTVKLSEKERFGAGHYSPRARVTNSHAGDASDERTEGWQPIAWPRRGRHSAADLARFYAYLLTPGLSLSFHSASLGRSRSSIASYRAAAVAAARCDPAIPAMVEAAVGAMRAEDGLLMAQRRGAAQLPFWSRLAICEYRKRGLSRTEIASAFRCSLGTVANVLQGKGGSYGALSGERNLTDAQRNPPGKWLVCINSRTASDTVPQAAE